MFERFTVEARGVVLRAREEALQMRHHYVGTEHVLVSLLSEEAGLAYAVLHDAGLDAAQVRAEIMRLVDPPPKFLSDEDAAALRTIGIDLDAVLEKLEQNLGSFALGPPPPPTTRRGLLGRKQVHGGRFTPRAKKVLELSLREAIHIGHNYIGTEHILLGLVREGEGLAAKILTEAGVPLDGLRRVVLGALGKAA